MSKRIPLTQGKFAIVDTADFEWLNHWKWYALKQGRTFYAGRYRRKADGPGGGIVLMHREILNPVLGKESDHINGVGTDNRRCNLRICTHQENMMNQKKRAGCSSQFRGVHWHKQREKWETQIHYDGICHNLGLFINEADAARAYNVEAAKHHSTFANPNVIEEEP